MSLLFRLQRDRFFELLVAVFGLYVLSLAFGNLCVSFGKVLMPRFPEVVYIALAADALFAGTMILFAATEFKLPQIGLLALFCTCFFVGSRVMRVVAEGSLWNVAIALVIAMLCAASMKIFADRFPSGIRKH